MNGDDEVVVDPRERWFEVLLEQAFAPAVNQHAAYIATRRSYWLAAAIALLGVGVVLGVVALRNQEAVQAQDPQPPAPPKHSWDGNAVSIANQADWDAVKDKVDRVVLRLLRTRPEDGAVEEIAGATAILTGPEGRAFAALVPPIGSQPVDPTATESPRFDAWLAFEISGRRVHAFVRFSDQPTLAVGSRRTEDLPEAWQQALAGLLAKASHQWHIARGAVQSLDELAQVPEGARAIRCPEPPSGSFAKLLGRFTQLEHLEFAPFTTNLGAGQPISLQLPERPTTAFVELQALPKLRHLRIPSSMLDDERAAELARLPALTSLRIDGAIGFGDAVKIGSRGGITVTGMRTLANKLDAIELVDGDCAPELYEPWIAAGRLRKLVLFGDALAPELLARLASIPTLRELGLGSVHWTDAHMRALAGSRIEVLRLEYTEASIPGLLGLPRSLRLLDLRRQQFTERADPRLEATLPDCRILRPGQTDANDTDPFAGIPGTTRR